MGEIRKIGRYQIKRELGRGAMGVVYHAIDPTIGRPVAIKTLRLRDLDDGDQRRRLRERLFREARSAGALSHPGIVTIYDMDEVDGVAYIAMEFVDGQTLEEILSKADGIPRERVNEILRQAAAALDYAHRKGIIHRDIKPANVMIDSTGAVKITDFGIAKITELEGQTLTGVLVGTPNYMSPEQVQGHEIDGRSDQFSLAVIAYEMLSGERPFYGEQISTVVYKIVADHPVPIQNINSSLDDGTDKVLRRGLAKKPEKRFGSCTALITALDASLENTKGWRVLPRKAHQNLPTSATSALTRTVRPSRKRPVPFETSGEAAGQKRRSYWLLPFLGAFLFLLLLLAAVAWQTGSLEIPWGRTPERQSRGLPSAGAAGERTAAKPQAEPPAATGPPATAEVDQDRQSPMPEPPSPDAQKGATSAARPPNAANEDDRGAGTPQQLQVITDPPGATATLDGSSAGSCQTPCKLQAPAGTHTVTVKKDGFQTESREIRVEHGDLDVPLIALRSANGILLLTSEPSGAHVWVDGKPTDFVTPVQISLPSGRHEIAIQRDGIRSADQVDIRNGAISTLKLSFTRE